MSDNANCHGKEEMKKEEKAWDKYRDLLMSSSQAAQSYYDRIIVALSGGGMCVLLWFMFNIPKSDIVVLPRLLVYACLAWGCSLIVAIASHFTGIASIEKAIYQVDYDRKSLYEGNGAGGYLSNITDWLNYASGFLFILGLLIMGVFVAVNLR